MIRAAARGRADPKMYATRPATCDMRTTRCRVWLMTPFVTPFMTPSRHGTKPLTHSDTIQNAQSKLTARYHDPPPAPPSSLARSTCGALERTYWNVGLFRYYELKQIPNFGLAAPALVLAGGAAVRFGAAALGPSRPAGDDTTAGAALQSRLRLGAHAAHLAILALTCLLVANVQVGYTAGRRCVDFDGAPFQAGGAGSSLERPTDHAARASLVACLLSVAVAHEIATRLLAAACPVLQWHSAWLVRGGGADDGGWWARAGTGTANRGARAGGSAGGTWRRALLAYHALFWLLGVVLHPNFLPWT